MKHLAVALILAGLLLTASLSTALPTLHTQDATTPSTVLAFETSPQTLHGSCDGRPELGPYSPVTRHPASLPTHTVMFC